MSKLPPKDEVLLELLRHGSVFVHLDPRLEGVTVPAWLAEQPQLVLQLGYDLPIPIDDLEVDAQGWRATLSFNRSPFLCTVPWAAVFALVDEEGLGMLWPDSLPEELRVELRREVGDPEQEAAAAPAQSESPKDSDEHKGGAVVVSLAEARRRRGGTVRPLRPAAARPSEGTSSVGGRAEGKPPEDEPPEEPPTPPKGRRRPPHLKLVD